MTSYDAQRWELIDGAANDWSVEKGMRWMPKPGAPLVDAALDRDAPKRTFWSRFGRRSVSGE